ncbi:hypothetical protein [Salinibacterium sp.]|uniref:hypothetical protein n=1 Tax=Salinibacterium sp. TaxID=1915057 RepID=UPI00286C38FB|nr:hypothetical protein [Salinibacterium sp.]
MLMAHLPGRDAATLADYGASNGLGGLILMGDNIPGSTEELAAMTAVIAGDSGLPVLVAADQEGGIVRRIPYDEEPSALELRVLPADEAAEIPQSQLSLRHRARTAVRRRNRRRRGAGDVRPPAVRRSRSRSGNPVGALAPHSSRRTRLRGNHHHR